MPEKLYNYGVKNLLFISPVSLIQLTGNQSEKRGMDERFISVDEGFSPEAVFRYGGIVGFIHNELNI